MDTLSVKVGDLVLNEYDSLGYIKQIRTIPTFFMFAGEAEDKIIHIDWFIRNGIGNRVIRRSHYYKSVIIALKDELWSRPLSK